METKEAHLTHLFPLQPWMWPGVLPSIQQSFLSPCPCATHCAKQSKVKHCTYVQKVDRSFRSPGTHRLTRWRCLGAVPMVQLRELHVVGSWRRESPLLKVGGRWLFFAEGWESWWGSVEKTLEECEFKEFQATWFCNILQLALEGKRLENHL